MKHIKKSFPSLIIILLVTIISIPSVASAMLHYLDQVDVFRTIADEERYDDLIQAVDDFKADHPTLMPDDWAERIKDVAIQARDAFIPNFNSEYDVFENMELKWFGNHKAVGPNDPYAIFDGTNGLIFSFYLPVDNWIYIKEFTALINNYERISAKVKNWDCQVIASQRYETFFVDLSILDSEAVDSDQFNSLGFRFYGKNRDKYIDVYINDETMNYFRQVTSEKVTSQDVKDIIWEWAKSIDEIIDYSIIPSWATRMAETNSVPVLPTNIQTCDYWNFQELDEIALQYSLNRAGSTYFFPCYITRIHEGNSESSAYWYVDIRSEYGRYLTDAYVILDIAMEYDEEAIRKCEAGDKILIAAVFAGRDRLNRKMFFLGCNEETVELACNVDFD